MSTIHDVAKLAEVSIKTVSRVINDQPNVKEPTVKRVRDAMDKLSFRPNNAARTMRTGKSNIFGVITGEISSMATHPWDEGLSSMLILRGMQNACRGTGKILMMAESFNDPREVTRALGVFSSHRVDGIFILTDSHRQVSFPLDVEAKVVMVNCFDSMGTPCVVPDEKTGMAEAVRSLYENGHRRMTYVSLPENMVASVKRSAAFLETCKALGLKKFDCEVKYAKDFDTPQLRSKSLEAILREIFSVKPAEAPTALLFGNDQMATLAKNTLTRLGKRIPEDISIVGYDNDPKFAEIMNPALSTVELPYYGMGIAAMETMTDICEGRQPTEIPREIGGGFVARNTVKKIN